MESNNFMLFLSANVVAMTYDFPMLCCSWIADVTLPLHFRADIYPFLAVEEENYQNSQKHKLFTQEGCFDALKRCDSGNISVRKIRNQ